MGSARNQATHTAVDPWPLIHDTWRVCVRVVVRVSALIILGLTLSTSNWQSDTQTHGDISCACARVRVRERRMRMCQWRYHSASCWPF